MKKVTRLKTYFTPCNCNTKALLSPFLMPKGLIIGRQHHHKNDFVIVIINMTFSVTHKGRAAQHTLASGHHSTYSLNAFKKQVCSL